MRTVQFVQARKTGKTQMIIASLSAEFNSHQLDQLK